MKGFIVASYIILIVVFLAVSVMIFRHTIKLSYLSPRFKIVVLIFSMLSLAIIIFSAYLVISLFGVSSFSVPSLNSGSDINF